MPTQKKSLDRIYREKQIEKQINNRFNEVYSSYEEQKCKNKEENLKLFAKLNGEWKGFCYKIAQRQKLVEVNPFAFQNKVWADNKRNEENKK